MFKTCPKIFYKYLGGSPRYTGFTLAEVLITLGIIGVLAAMTIPTLLNSINDMHYKSAYKKAYADLQQAFLTAKDQGLLVDTTQAFTGNNDGGNNLNTDQIMQQMKIIKSCNTNNNGQCWDATGERFGKVYSSGTGRPSSAADYNSYLDASGRSWTAIEVSQGRIAVDTNGFQKPNQYGKDRFVFHLFPINLNSDTVAGVPFKILPYADNHSEVCKGNVCETANNYYGTTWLMN